MDELIKLEALVLLPVSHNRAALGINQRLVQQKSASLLKLVALSWLLCLHRGNIQMSGGSWSKTRDVIAIDVIRGFCGVLLNGFPTKTSTPGGG